MAMVQWSSVKQPWMQGYDYLAVETIDEAIELRDAEIHLPILIFGEVSDAEFGACLAYQITCCVNDIHKAKRFNELAKTYFGEQQSINVHIEIDTGMSRWGVHWDEALPVVEYIAKECGIFAPRRSHESLCDVG